MAASSPQLDIFTDNPLKIYTLSSSLSPEIVRYIGYTTQELKERLRCHLKEAKYKRYHREKWINQQLKKGAEILIEEIDNAENLEQLKLKEIHYIKLFKSFGARLVNGTKGGDGNHGLVHTEETKRKISRINSRKVYCFNFQTKELIGEYPSCAQMNKELGLFKTTTSKVITGRKVSHRGMTFSYKPIFPTRKSKVGKKVYVDRDGELLVFKDLKTFCREVGVSDYRLIYRRLLDGSLIKGFKILNIAN